MSVSTLQSTECMCGEFAETVNPDLGQASPYRLKLDCEAPTLPAITALDSDPDASPQFTAA